ncbi:tRNA glutamyl-Q(34) synthetase GluQRS [Acetobacter farinalis]|uniref:tRNA glutamyl-Q(34) synthetase GluQRS n=1 Tax=Acetobacter farinalis TaxID=1260984 RepID=A0ABT3Q6X9_9PROT|nr:tRNA glutamyl-Q(34) synthetase GluQRS [Acetobacter farinalis]MCX2561052.1 tRNA glutamyl-Q(34) synthetase GluQRS [Acetobacter farinalis]NHO29698.1 tRNA glutamyl-Q(34) synthetase GluQRS [Acetobacter farinalis]
MTERSWNTRFAPSPTGFLHLGHVASALAGWVHKGPYGTWLVRMEDIDPQRCRESYMTALLDDLEWLGLRSSRPVLRQSANMAAYRATLERLDQMGVLYPCFCTRSDIAREFAGMMSAPHTAPDGSLRYPGLCRHLSEGARAAALAEGRPHVLRLDMARALEVARALEGAQTHTAASGAGSGVTGWQPAEPGTGHGIWPLTYTDLERGIVRCQPDLFGDVVLARRDVPASYHLCVTHDDAAQGITLVTRGEDLRAATDLHRLLQALMGWPTPAYLFHPLLCDAEGRRLSKRDGAKAVRSMRMAGLTPEDVRRAAGYPGVFW